MSSSPPQAGRLTKLRIHRADAVCRSSEPCMTHLPSKRTATPLSTLGPTLAWALSVIEAKLCIHTLDGLRRCRSLPPCTNS
jgi:hypothetical protein